MLMNCWGPHVGNSCMAVWPVCRMNSAGKETLLPGQLGADVAAKLLSKVVQAGLASCLAA